MLTNADITVFNRFLNPVTKLDEYKRTYLYGVNWNSSKGVNVIRSGMESADSAIVQIPFDVISEKNYKKPKEWQNVPEEMELHWTLQSGDKIVKGIVDYDISTGTIAQLEKQYDEVLTITSVDTIDSGSQFLRHFRVGAR